MADRVTPVEIEEMNRLYVLCGTYAEVGRMMKRSGSTVARYIDKRITSKYEIETTVNVVKR